jgi:hypothetical protein
LLDNFLGQTFLRFEPKLLRIEDIQVDEAVDFPLGQKLETVGAKI